MQYLITGGAGFIGSHLTDSLLQDGHEVAVLDDLSTGSTDNLRKALLNPRFRFVEGDVCKSRDLKALVKWADVIYHLAAAVGVDLVVQRPVQTIETNVHGTENVFDLATKAGKRVIIASTSEVYGKAMAPQFKETDDLLIGPPTHFRWSYAASKALDEYLAFAYRKEYGLQVTIARLFNTVGPRQTGRYGMVLPRFVGQALKNDPVRVFGNGDQTRCFCFVGDTVAAFRLLADRPGTEGEIFNVGSSTSISINRLASRVISLTGSRSEIVHIPYSEAYGPGFEDMQRRVPDTTKLRTLTGWEPRQSLDDIILSVKAFTESQLMTIA